MERNKIALFARGAAMGAADIIPGVSGGTIAFITGIYEELIASIAGLTPGKLMLLKKGWSIFWREINGAFLLTVFAGVLFSVFSLAKLISFLLAEYPILVWAFFFGLIVASVHFVGKQVKHWSFTPFLSLIGGAALAYLVGSIPSNSIEATPPAVFLSGFIAISAMILPGISGSFILVLLGMYQSILQAVKTLDLVMLSTFAAGCVAGLMVMSRILTWAFRHFHDLTMAFLTGIMIGALNKVWPWKETLTWRENSHGEQVPVQQISVLPDTYEKITGSSADLLWVLLLMLLGFSIVLIIEFLGRKTR